MRWARGQLTDDELDVEFLMWDIQRRLDLDKLPGGETVLCFIFDDLSQFKNWWLVASDAAVDLCTENPGKEVDIYINSNVRTIIKIWEGDLDMHEAMRSQAVKALGPRHLIRSLPDWFFVGLYK